MRFLALLLLLQAAPSGDAVIRKPAGKSDIVIRTTQRLAGAIDSLTWGGMEFIDSSDHGRQLQSASNLDAGSAISDETFNPTEAGSRADGAGPKSSSVLLSIRAADGVLETRSKMAFWLKPGETSGGKPAKNTTIVSEHVLSKKVTIGFEDLPHVIEYVTTFTIPAGESHTQATFEALTGYLPHGFSRFLAFDAAKGAAVPLSDGPGEQSLPVILSTPSGGHAMGVWSPERPGPGYGRFRFAAEKVVKWNSVIRVKRPGGIPPGEFTCRNFVAVGTLDDVVSSMKTLHARFAERK